jgi:spermidine synthase
MVRFSEAIDLAIELDDLDVVEALTSTRQRLQILRHPKLGLVLVIDDVLQHAEAWQALYHEPLVHLAAAFVREVKSALVLGGGSLFAAAELLRYPTLERCTLVDHDGEVLALMARHYRHARRVLADPRFAFVQDDALAHIVRTGDTHDLIVNDALDLLAGPGGPAFELLAAHVNAGGACADVIYRDLFEPGYVQATRAVLDKLGKSAASLIFVPEYPGILHVLTIWGGDHIDQQLRTPHNQVQRAWCAGAPSGLEFYNPNFMAFHLYVPPLLQRVWDSASR